MEEYPPAPPALYMLGAPALLYGVRQLPGLRSVPLANFLRATAYACWVTAAGTLLVWIGMFTSLLLRVTLCASADATVLVHGTNVVWQQHEDRWWTPQLRNLYKQQMEACGWCNVQESGCDPVQIHEYCLPAFLLWFNPFIATMAGVFFGVLSLLLSCSLANRMGEKSNGAARLIGMLCMTSIVGMWIGAEIAGSEMGLSNVVGMFSAAGLVIVGAVVLSTVGWTTFIDSVKRMPFVTIMSKFLASDWLLAASVMACGPVYVVLLGLSFIIQLLRKSGLPCMKPIQTEEEASHAFTIWATQQLNAMRRWHWTSLLNKVFWLGFLYVAVIVGVGKATTIFLSWLNFKLAALSVGQVYGIFIAVGITMFLLPPVPGVPVYLTGGIILVNASEDLIGYVESLVVVCFIGLALKLLALCIQQKVFGEALGRFVVVRQKVGINSLTIKAIRWILETPGLSLPKVCILVGGPDWPTSVLTGIMGLKLYEMVLGTLPVFALIVPTVLAGGFQLKKTESETWESIAGIVLAIAAFVQGAGLLAAVYHIEKVATEKHEELLRMPDDEEVRQADHAGEKRKAAASRVLHWDGKPMMSGPVRPALVEVCTLTRLASQTCSSGIPTSSQAATGR
eukprot:scaffold1248_cov393-Prasinococcus_capsulatus_cf.AAC.23